MAAREGLSVCRDKLQEDKDLLEKVLQSRKIDSGATALVTSSYAS